MKCLVLLSFSVNPVFVCFEELHALAELFVDKQAGKGFHFTCQCSLVAILDNFTAEL